MSLSAGIVFFSIGHLKALVYFVLGCLKLVTGVVTTWQLVPEGVRIDTFTDLVDAPSSMISRAFFSSMDALVVSAGTATAKDTQANIAGTT